MKKRSAEKVIARSILALASYRKTTMSRALRRRPRFWTVARPVVDGSTEPPSKRLRLEFGDTEGGPTLDSSFIRLDDAAGGEFLDAEPDPDSALM